MEIDLAILTLPDFEGLDGISPRGRQVIENAHRHLAGLAAKHRKGPYEYGKWFSKIRNTLAEEGQAEGYTAYCRRMDVKPERFRECIRIFETFEAYVDLLHMIPVSMQVMLASSSVKDHLPDAIELARAGIEVTRLWLDEQMGVAEVPQLSVPKEEDDEPDDDDYEEDDDEDEEEDYDAIDDRQAARLQRKIDEDNLLQNTLSLADREESRKELCRILMEEVQLLKRRLVTWMRMNKVYEGQWYADAERSLDLFSQSLKAWQTGDVIRIGE
jgi:hypothetical protein